VLDVQNRALRGMRHESSFGGKERIVLATPKTYFFQGPRVNA